MLYSKDGDLSCSWKGLYLSSLLFPQNRFMIAGVPIIYTFAYHFHLILTSLTNYTILLAVDKILRAVTP